MTERFERFERFSYVLFEISRYWHKLTAEEMAKYGLKGPHAVYLTALYRYEDGVTAPQLCELCGKDKSDVSRMTAIMEEKGLITREDNRYRGRLKLTEEGRRAADFVRERAALAVEIAGRDLSDEARQTLYEALGCIAANLRKLSDEGLPNGTARPTKEEQA